jgi:hypothetical protein
MVCSSEFGKTGFGRELTRMNTNQKRSEPKSHHGDTEENDNCQNRRMCQKIQIERPKTLTTKDTKEHGGERQLPKSPDVPKNPN